MKTRISFLLGLVLFSLCLSGCGGDNGTTSVESPAGTGYRIGIQSSNQNILNGSSILLTVWATGPDGKPVLNDDNEVTFSASLPVTWDNSGKAKITNGTAVMTMTYTDSSSTDNPDPSRSLRVTASYRGAVASIELVAVSKTF